MYQVFGQLRQHKLLPIVTIDKAEQALPLADV